MTDTGSAVTLKEMQERFPDLRWIFKTASKHSKDADEMKWRFYSELKMAASVYVGWNSLDERFSSGKAYDLMIKELTRRLRI
jgi:hypothetical protein